MPTGSALIVCAFGAGLLATIVLAAYLTPGRWWRRANARALTVLAAGTCAIGSLLLWIAGGPGGAADPAASAAELRPESALAGRSFRVFDNLNLRAASGVGARREVVVPAGTTVTATGARDGDWWEVSARIGGHEVRGWASSLWLRRADERRP
jgi:ferric-dicitrate binding protein FerR (iron transport regulator)